jgi:chloride channel protein, CIC family
MVSSFKHIGDATSKFLALMWRRANIKLGVTFRILLLSGLVGVVAGIGAIVFQYASESLWELSLSVLNRRPQIGSGQSAFVHPLIFFSLPAMGGLLSGWVVWKFAPEAAGHGTDAAIEAYHRKRGYIRPQVPLVKLLASAITIGTGGSGGREGPIAQIGAGFGSILGRALHLSRKERRVLMVAGVGAGVGAIFRAPIAGAIFASEVLYSDPDFESEVVIPTGIAAAVAYAVFASGVENGLDPLFTTPDFSFRGPLELGPYLVLALTMAFLAGVYVQFFYFVHRLFERWTLHPIVKPAVGGLLTGIVGYVVWSIFAPIDQGRLSQDALSVMSYGYDVLQRFLARDTAGDGFHSAEFSLLIVVAFSKVITTSCTIGSGGSGGVFGPSMVIGGCAGGAMGIIFHQWIPEICPDPGAYVLVGMAGFFAAAAKTPVSTLLMVSEMTGSYKLLTPSLWVCSIAYIASSRHTLFRSQVSSRMTSPAHQGEYVREILANVTVDHFLRQDERPRCIHMNANLASVVKDFDGTQPLILPVVDDQDALRGMITLDEVHWATLDPSVAPMLVAADLMREDIIPLYRGDTLYRAMELFGRNDQRALPIVVVEQGHEKVVGIIQRSDVQIEYLKRVHGQSPGEPTRPQEV